MPSRDSCWRGVDTDPHQRLQIRKAEPPAVQGCPLQDAAFEKPWARRPGPGASLRGHSARVGDASPRTRAWHQHSWVPTAEVLTAQNMGKACKGQGRAGSPQPRQPGTPLSSRLLFQMPTPTPCGCRRRPGAASPGTHHHPGRRDTLDVGAGPWPITTAGTQEAWTGKVLLAPPRAAKSLP